jgi:hypothetical protein
MLVGHLLYGTMLGRYPAYVHRLMNTAPAVVEAPAVAVEQTSEGQAPQS